MKIFINMISLFKGGPKTVGLGILQGINHSDNHEWFLLLPSGEGYESYLEDYKIILNKNIKVIYAIYPNVIFKPFLKLFYDNLFTPIYFYLKKIDIVFMTGNFSSWFLNSKSQIILEHNALYFEKYSTNFDNNKFKYLLGKFLLYCTFKSFPRLVVQLHCIKNKIVKIYGYPHEKIKVVTMVPISIKNTNNFDIKTNLILEKIGHFSSKLKFFFPANFYPGKNHKILIPLAELAIKYSYPVVFFLTLPNDCKFMSEVRAKNLGSVLVNLGHIPLEKMDSIYGVIDFLFFPSYAESYGMPYVEAIKNSVPILTADYDFSREICGAAAIYFKQDDMESLHEAMNKCLNSEIQNNLKHAVKNEKLRFSHGWDSIINDIFMRLE